MGNQNEVVVVEKNGRLSLAKKIATGTALAVAAVSSHAEVGAPDMTPIVTMINGLVAVVGSVGMAVLSVYATAKVFKWVKTAF